MIFSIISTLLRLVFSKEAILFLIYLLADKAKHWVNSDGKLLFKSKEVHSHLFFKNVSNFHKKFNAKTPRLFSPFVKLLFPLVFVAKDQHELRKRRFVKKWKCNKKTNFSTNWCTSTYHYVLCNISNNLMNSELLICFLEKYCKKNSDWKSIRMYHFYFEFIQFFLVVRIIIIYSFLFWGKTKTNKVYHPWLLRDDIEV